MSNLNFPANPADLSNEDLASLISEGEKAFADIYGDGSNDFTDEQTSELSTLGEGVKALRAEREAREIATRERNETAAALAADVLPDPEEADAEADEAPVEEAPAEDEAPDEAETVEDEAPAEEAEADEKPEEVKAEEAENTVTPEPALVASATKNEENAKMTKPDAFSAQTNTAAAALAEGEPKKSMKSVAFSSATGEGTDWTGIGNSIADQLTRSYNAAAYAAANRGKRHLSQTFGIANFKKPSAPGLVIDTDSPEKIEEILRNASKESRLSGNSLVASGGWCSPSETIYDLCEMESNDGLFDLPEVTVNRGGISRTLGPNFADIYNQTGFAYTEAEDAAGNYDGNGGGEKPCYNIECPDFEEFRLNVAGLCLTAGLLQQKSYPELLARTARGALVAHAHKMSARYIEAVENGSTAITMPADNGATAPLLAAIEKQAEHMRYSQRMSRSATIEVVLPYWVRGAIREDLSKRPGTDLDPFSVSDAQITGWFTLRNISVQFVYDWQDINLIDPAAFTGYPDKVKMLMYPAGTWVKGGSNIITLDTLYDSQMLRTNDFTALFTEESWMVVKMCQDSRVVTVPLCADGSTKLGVDMLCNSVTLPTGAAGDGFPASTTTTTVPATTTTTTAR